MKDRRQANKGLEFEELINHANEQYRARGIAVIVKIPTEWVIIRKYDPRTRKNVIKTAYPKQKSPVDYIGTYYNRPVAFEAKTTTNKTRFPLNNIQDHQNAFLEHWRKTGGKAFYLIHFKAHNKIFILYQKQLEEFTAKNDRKSIPLAYFERFCQKAEQEGNFVLHYLKDLF